MPDFPDEGSSAPLIVYERHRQKDVPLLTPPLDPSAAPDPIPNLAPGPTPATSSSHVPLQRSNRLTRLPNGYCFTHTSLLATLSSVSIPNSYSQAVKYDC